MQNPKYLVGLLHRNRYGLEKEPQLPFPIVAKEEPLFIELLRYGLIVNECSEGTLYVRPKAQGTRKPELFHKL
ncbi:MAG TPA: hypothetical protein DDW42_08390 [Desulfobacteraceae bacterium]|nr:hypothetical protein [Desulfobacteraceae bacterium]